MTAATIDAVYTQHSDAPVASLGLEVKTGSMADALEKARRQVKLQWAEMRRVLGVGVGSVAPQWHVHLWKAAGSDVPGAGSRASPDALERVAAAPEGASAEGPPTEDAGAAASAAVSGCASGGGEWGDAGGEWGDAVPSGMCNVDAIEAAVESAASAAAADEFNRRVEAARARDAAKGIHPSGTPAKLILEVSEY